ncbi:hypothetical protein O181_051711 [Austropuccinia psidii MF-1]|uniref:Uncharacterized protein n=1 Tax=Austropuccinia psidii MF-1 TaxID=1389203 RepID=A0A9Q3DWZ0_9BASI|nr:hypothetical protein [Austropuccinia psidii MF-1]
MLLLFVRWVLVLSSPHGTIGSPEKSAANRPTSSFRLSALSNAAAMEPYLVPRCEARLKAVSSTPQTCYRALSQFPFDKSSHLILGTPMTRSYETCSLTISSVPCRANSCNAKISTVPIHATAFFGPIGQILQRCSNAGGRIYLRTAYGKDLEIRVQAIR